MVCLSAMVMRCTRSKVVAYVWLTHYLSLVLRHWILQRIVMLFEWSWGVSTSFVSVYCACSGRLPLCIGFAADDPAIIYINVIKLVPQYNG